jgi:hypothetical protein
MEEGWTWFREQLQNTVEKYVPKSSSRTKLKNPWMTREILRLIRKKRKVWKKAKYSSLPEDMAEYKRIEKEVSNKIRNAKRKLEKDLVSGPDKNNRNFARYVKTKTKSRTTIGPLITKDKRVLRGKGHGRGAEQVFLKCLYKKGLDEYPRTRERTGAIKNERNKS